MKLQENVGHEVSEINNRALQPPDRRDHTKRSLLAAAASQNYQRCYKALKMLESYWSGTRYILTVLDQRLKGSLDPLLYTAEYLGGASETSATPNVPVPPNGRSNLGRDIVPGIFDAGHDSRLARLKSAVASYPEDRRTSKMSGPSQGRDYHPLYLHPDLQVRNANHQ